MSDHILVTGGAGFIGAHIVQRLVKEGHRVRVVDNLSTGNLQRLTDVISTIEFTEADLADPLVCDRVVDGIEYVVHQAAIPSVQRSIRDPITSNCANITATLNLLESCRNQGVRRLVYAASSSAYGDTAVLPKREDMPPNPLSPYALQKFVGERYCGLYHDLYGLETVSLRYFNVFGPGQDPNSEYSAVIPKFIKGLLAFQPLIVFGDGEQSRDFTYVENVVQANIAALHAEGAVGRVFNIAYGERISLNTLIGTLERIIGVKAKVKFEPTRNGDVRHSLADIHLARSILGYEPNVGVEQGLKKTVEAMTTTIGS
ncbi:MAG: SDR family oxidoreductase [Deltaproteobacteria bacterium]|jgi:UDP-N-acetylglucosamine/UDP-N-acetyl-alpha-D-glucosaminouronate 4-epimerase|nr:MAG: SDR family oxidoreductase [Deltaproteobacteria bacterium]